jgi:dipeptidyl aminopeptidase/acylaminoacyl peptidase
MSTKRPLELADLFRLRVVSDAQIAPDGSRVAFVLRQMDEEKDEYVSNIYVVDRSGTISQFTAGNKDSAPRWSPDGRYLAFLSGRKEGNQLYLLSTAGGESVAITERKLGAGRPVWSPDSTAIVFTALVSTDPDEDEKEDDKEKKAPTKVIERAGYKSDGVGYIGNRRGHLFLVTVADRTVEQLTEGDYFANTPSWSPDSRHIAFVANRAPRWDLSFESNVYVIPREGGEARQLTCGSSFENPVFSPDGSRIAVAGQQDPREAFAPERLYSITRAGTDLRDELGDWTYGVGNSVTGDVALWTSDIGLTWRDDGLYFLAAVRGECNIYRAAEGRVDPVTHGQQMLTDFSVACDGTLAYSRSDAVHPPQITIQSGETTETLTHENEDWLAEVQIIQPERFTFTGAGDEENDGWLLAPRGHTVGKHPLLVYIHGGPHTAHGEVFFFEYQFLAGQGFGIFYPNIHGSSSYGRDYQASIWHDWGNKDFEDIMAGTRVAMARDWVDERRLGILGGSYGGFMTVWTLGHADLFRAGITERGLHNWISFIGTSDGGWIWDLITGVYPEQDIQRLWDLSPLKYVPNISVPLMVMHSEGDDRCPVEQGEELFTMLRRLGKDTKFIRFPEESHGLSRMGTPSRRVERQQFILDWLKEKL